MKKIIRDLLKNKKVLSYLIIIFISIFVCIPLFSKYMDISRDDGIQHICRLIGTYNTIKEGHVFPMIMSDFCNGFGYSWNLFYSPLTAYIPLIFKLFTSSFVVCLKLFMLLTIALSGIFMYQFVYKITKSYKAGVVSAVLYMCAPYHLTDLYNRIAIAELASFIFLPIIFSGMYDLFHRRNKKPFGIIIGAVGLILTHNVMAVYTAIFCLIYLLINFKKLKIRGTIKKILICVLLILLCTSFYWIPLLEHMLTTTYEVFLPDRMYKDNTLISSKLSILELLFTEHYQMNFHIGFAILIGLFLTFCYRKKLPKRYQELIKIFLIFGLISIITTLKIFPFEYLPDTLKMIQFPWRMMEFESFFLSIVAGIGFAHFMNYNSKKEIYAVIFIIVYICGSLIVAKRSVEIPFNEERYLQPVPVTSSTGRVHAGCASFEYLPQKAFSNRSYIEQRSNEVIILERNATISETKKENTNLTFKIEQSGENTKLELPYIFYLGYSAKLEKEDGTSLELKIEESDYGFCMITVPNVDNASIIVSYTGTIFMKISYVLTVIGIIGIVYMKTKESI
ncbi:MAG: hypothetical protein J6A04_04635 [Clostridia bacterium]|nr:hypothetical protein [Clostridia bacterium]